MATQNDPSRATRHSTRRRGPASRSFVSLTCLLGAFLCVAIGCADTESDDGFDSTAYHPSESGDYMLMAVRNPDPPVTGLNSLAITLVDAGGEPVPGQHLRVEPWMPAHGHGTTVVEAAEVEVGQYATEELYFNMPGAWEIRVMIEDPASPDTQDRVVFDFEVR